MVYRGILPSIQKPDNSTVLYLFQSSENQGNLPNLFLGARITLMPKHDKDITKKYYRPSTT